MDANTKPPPRGHLLYLQAETDSQVRPGDKYCLKPNGRFVTIHGVLDCGKAVTFTFDDGKDAIAEWPLDEFLKWAVKYDE